MALTPAAGISLAQEVGARRPGASVTSPEVGSDRRVTFRLRAPGAKTVTVSGDFGNDTELRKSEDDIWSVTVGPLEPKLTSTTSQSTASGSLTRAIHR